MEYKIDEFGHCSIPEGTKTIEYQKFKNCTNLKSIKIPDSVISIEAQAFEGCSNLYLEA